jgi:hypothetical protein
MLEVLADRVVCRDTGNSMWRLWITWAGERPTQKADCTTESSTGSSFPSTSSSSTTELEGIVSVPFPACTADPEAGRPTRRDRKGDRVATGRPTETGSVASTEERKEAQARATARARAILQLGTIVM